MDTDYNFLNDWYIYICIYIYIYSSHLVGLQGYIPYPHIAAVCIFELVVLLLLGHMWGSIGDIAYELVPAFPAVSCISGSSNLDSFHDGRIVGVLWGVAAKTCSILLATFLCNCRPAFSPAV